ncbi:MAG: 5'/3'-nucleotidase SurE [Planctomycetota bacterium]
MHILLTNDDGIFAPGLAAIYKRLTGVRDTPFRLLRFNANVSM